MATGTDHTLSGGAIIEAVKAAGVELGNPLRMMALEDVGGEIRYDCLGSKGYLGNVSLGRSVYL